jgi:release factor glutamine methyltransferase
MAWLDGIEFTLLKGVYPPSEDTFMLIDALKGAPLSGKALELCCGSGAVSLSVARRIDSIVAVDINPLAVANTRINYERNGLSERLDAVAGDLFSPLGHVVFDLILMNPPYIPDDALANDPCWSGGTRGREIIDRFLDKVGGFLSPPGSAFFIQSDINGEEESLDRIRSGGMEGRVVRSASFRFERIMVIQLRRGQE